MTRIDDFNADKAKDRAKDLERGNRALMLVICALGLGLLLAYSWDDLNLMFNEHVVRYEHEKRISN